MIKEPNTPMTPAAALGILAVVFFIAIYVGGNSTASPAADTITSPVSDTFQNTYNPTPVENNSPSVTQPKVAAPTSAPAPASTVSNKEMSQSCQAIADAQLRTGVYESAAVLYRSAYARPSTTGDVARYDATNSMCYFVTFTDEYPKVYSVTDPNEKATLYLYAAALLPDGTVQLPAPGGSGVQLAAWCTSTSYTYPKVTSELKCLNFALQQSGAGTNNYQAHSLGVGISMTRADFKTLVENYMQMDTSALLQQLASSLISI